MHSRGFIDRTAEWAVKHESAPPDGAVPSYDESWLDGDDRTPEQLAKYDLRAAERRLAMQTTELGSGARRTASADSVGSACSG